MIYADFSNADASGRIRLNLRGSMDDIEKQTLVLRDGLEIEVSDGELKAQGIVQFSHEEKIWVVRIHWPEVRDV